MTSKQYEAALEIYAVMSMVLMILLGHDKIQYTRELDVCESRTSSVHYKTVDRIK